MITLVVINTQIQKIEALARHFARVSDISLISYAHDGIEAIEIVNKYQPDVVLMELGIPPVNGVEATKIISHRFPDIKIILLINQGDQRILNLALEAGAKGVVFKNTSLKDIEETIRLVTNVCYQIEPILSERNQAKSTAISLNNENNNITEILNGIKDLKKSIASNQEMMTTIVHQRRSKINKYSSQPKISPKKYEYNQKYLINLSQLGNDSFFITGFVLGVLCCAIVFYFLLSFLK